MGAAHPLPRTYAGRVQAPAQPERHPGLVRVSGTLTEAAELRPTTSQPPHLLLCLQLQPARGLAYVARVDLGPNPGDHLNAEACMPYLRRGAVVSVAGEALELRADFGHQVLRVVDPHSVVVLEHARDPEPDAAAPDLFAAAAQEA
jgi:hypothetical protein